MREKWIVSLEEVCRADTRLVGGKGANLGEMIRTGVRVPPGFAVTAEAYDGFLEETHAAKEIKQYLDKFGKEPHSFAECREVSQAIRGIITSKELPEALQGAIVPQGPKTKKGIKQIIVCQGKPG